MSPDISPELPASHYDALHSDQSIYGAHYSRSLYTPLFRQVVAALRERQAKAVLEVGCGSGTLAEMIADEMPGLAYRGFDFSTVAVERAGKRTGRAEKFFQGDARAPESYAGDYDAVVCTEVLEHIDDDLGVIANWRGGLTCVCSVPNFPYQGHVRVFRHADEVKQRYGGLIDIAAVHRVAVPVRGEGSTADWLRRLRWSRDNPRKFLGLLGVNTFDWLAGWFLLVGTRRG